MEEYTELYNNGLFKLYGQFERPIGYSRLTLKVDKKDFVGTGMFYLGEEDIVVLLNELEAMNNRLSGECIIRDHESANFCHLFFEGRQLSIRGHLTLYSAECLTFEDQVDQTVLLPLIQLLRKV